MDLSGLDNEELLAEEQAATTQRDKWPLGSVDWRRWDRIVDEILIELAARTAPVTERSTPFEAECG